MNRGLLIFSLLLILLGLGLSAYLISIFGALLLFPALLTSPRPRPQGTPTGSGQQAPEPAPEPTPVMETGPAMETAPEPPPTRDSLHTPGSSQGTASTPAAPQTVAPASMPPLPPSLPSFSAPLFPTNIFPSASQQIPTPQALKETRSEAPESRDDVLELGALLVLMKLVFG